MTDIFEALAAPARRAIMDALHDRNLQTLFELVGRLTNDYDLPLTRQAVSQHLQVLEDVGLVTTRREGRYKFHSLDATPLQAVTIRWLNKETP